MDVNKYCHCTSLYRPTFQLVINSIIMAIIRNSLHLAFPVFIITNESWQRGT